MNDKNNVTPMSMVAPESGHPKKASVKARERKQAEQAEKDTANLNQSVTRGEFIEVMTQISQNVAEITQACLDDVNALFKNFVLPTKIRMECLEQILFDKLGFTKDELDKAVYEYQKAELAKAKKALEKDQSPVTEGSQGNQGDSDSSSPAEP